MKQVCRGPLRVVIVNTEEMKVLQEVRIDYSSMVVHRSQGKEGFETCVELGLLSLNERFYWLKSWSGWKS